MIQARQETILLFWHDILSSHRNVFLFTRRMHKPRKGSLQNKMHLNSISKGCVFFLVKDFDQSEK